MPCWLRREADDVDGGRDKKRGLTRRGDERKIGRIVYMLEMARTGRIYGVQGNRNVRNLGVIILHIE